MQNDFSTRVTTRMFVELKFLRVASCIRIDSFFWPELALVLLRFCCALRSTKNSSKIEKESIKFLRGNLVDDQKDNGCLMGTAYEMQGAA